MKNKSTLVSSLVASLVLAACGGGGGGSSPSTTAASASSASSPSTASSPAATSTPTATVLGETPPSLSSPQTGSTAATGNGVAGIWSDSSSVDNTIALIDPQNNVSYVSALGSLTMSQFFGAITPSAPNWTLTSGTAYFGGFYYTITSGSGTFAVRQTFSGSYVRSVNTISLSWTYDQANALAVTQSSVAGTWAQTGSSITVASDGTVTGTLSNCPVTGTLLLATAGSNQNLYTLNLAAGTSSTLCKTPGVTLSGNAAIMFVPISGSSLYTRTIFYVIRSADNTSVASGQVAKQ